MRTLHKLAALLWLALEQAVEMVVVLAMLGTAIAFAVGLFLLTGGIVIVGLLPVLLTQYFLSPPRGVVVADAGVALTKRSFWTGRPHELVAIMAHGSVRPVEESLGQVKILVGNEDVWLSKKEEAILRGFMSQQGAPS